MTVKEYLITPIPKPRITHQGRFKPIAQRYYKYAEDIRTLGMMLPESGYHIYFIMPMPVSWSKQKKQIMCGQPHQQKPDKDNLEKAVLDAIFEDDSCVWDGRVTKIWGKEGKIIVKTEV